MADALSHRRHVISSMTLSVDLRSQILQALPTDSWYQEVCREIDSGRTLEGNFSDYVLESDGLLRHSRRIYVPLLDDIFTLILSEAHRAPYSAHPGVKKMHVDLRRLFYWSGMKRDISDFLARCLECQRVKAEHQHPAGLL